MNHLPSTSQSKRPIQWSSITPARRIPRSPLAQEHTTPARYHRPGYHTVEPDYPLWKELRAALRSNHPRLYKLRSGDWSLDWITITSRPLAQRITNLLLKHHPHERHHIIRTSELNYPPSNS